MWSFSFESALMADEEFTTLPGKVNTQACHSFSAKG